MSARGGGARLAGGGTSRPATGPPPYLEVICGGGSWPVNDLKAPAAPFGV